MWRSRTYIPLQGFAACSLGDIAAAAAAAAVVLASLDCCHRPMVDIKTPLLRVCPRAHMDADPNAYVRRRGFHGEGKQTTGSLVRQCCCFPHSPDMHVCTRTGIQSANRMPFGHGKIESRDPNEVKRRRVSRAETIPRICACAARHDSFECIY